MGPLSRTAARAALAVALVAVVAVVALGGCGSSDGDEASADAPADETVVVSGAWARPTPAGATVAAVYLTIEAAAPDMLLGATVASAVAGEAQLHMSMDNGAGGTMMHEIAAVEVSPGATTTFAPGADHVMLVDLAGPLEPGSTFDVSLDFERAGSRTAAVEVRDEAP